MSNPKNTRPDASSRRQKQEPVSRKRDAFPDKIDVRDWFYEPTLRPLPDVCINTGDVPVILDQGQEGACTGYALAAVVNFHLCRNGRFTKAAIVKDCVSPRMLYEMARKYDEWPGEDYEGSSARGTIKGWNAHGVVRSSLWAPDMDSASFLTEEIGTVASGIPAGAYYRVQHRQVRDMHNALYESGILFATLMVHSGWDDPKKTALDIKTYNLGKGKTVKLPVIRRQGRAEDGHAVAIVGYTPDGFVIQNSWGEDWGIGGYALLPYEDWLMHASDCWVAQLGVPVNANLWSQLSAEDVAGLQRASEAVPLEQIRPYVIDIGNNGMLSDSGQYWTTKEDIDRLFVNLNTKCAGWKRKRVMLYLHGGLNSEKEVARRIIAFRDVFMDNEIYPVHIMWETDFMSSFKSQVLDHFTDDDNNRAGAAWLNKFRDAVIEIKDRTFELSAARPGTALWDEMKENASLASRRGRAMDILANSAKEAWNSLSKTEQNSWELHIVGHSAGSIFMAYAIDALLTIGVPIASVQFMAPAVSLACFKEKLMDHILRKTCPLPTLYILSDQGERDDDVWLYGKSLLYLVSNAFEGRRGTPLLGMERFVSKAGGDLAALDKDVAKLFAGNNEKGWPNIVVAGAEPAPAKNAKDKPGPDISRSDSHGGFDNDPATLNSVMYRILGKAPKREFDMRDLQY